MNANFKVIVIALAFSSGAVSAQEIDKESESQESIGT